MVARSLLRVTMSGTSWGATSEDDPYGYFSVLLKRASVLLMKRLALAFVFSLFAFPAVSKAQVGVQIQIGLPVSPTLVVVQPGIQVVEDFDEEVFFTGGYYWLRRDNGWYRAPSPRARFVFVEPRRVPVGLVRLPPGQYKHWRKAEHKAWKEQEKAERKEMKEQDKAERKHGKHGY